MHAGARDRAETGLEADDAVEGGRPDHRAQCLRSQRQRHDAGGHRRGGAGRRAARRMPRVPRVGGRTGMTPGEFGRYCLAEDRGAELTQAFDHPGILRRHLIAIDRRSVGGRHVRRCDDVLDAHGDAGERASRRLRSRGRYSNAFRTGSAALRPREAGGRVAIGKPVVLFEAAQKLKHAGTEVRA